MKFDGRATIACLLLAILISVSTPLSAYCAPLIIFKSHEYLSRDYQVQNYQDTMAIAPNQQNLPLTMTIYNGSHELPSFKWFRLIINGQVFATEKDLAGRDVGVKDVTGLLEGNNLQVQVQAAGVPGAALWWTLSTSQLELNWANPTQATAGQQMMLGGTNFGTNASAVTVYFNGRPTAVNSVSGNTLTVTVPANVEAGVNHIQVKASNLESNMIAVNVSQRPVPELLGCDVWMAPPQGTINITGRNFSASSGENKVFFGDVQGAVTYSTPTQLTVTVPNWPYGPSQLNIPLSVEVNGVKSSNRIPFDIGPMYHGGVPQFGTD